MRGQGDGTVRSVLPALNEEGVNMVRCVGSNKAGDAGQLMTPGGTSR